MSIVEHQHFDSAEKFLAYLRLSNEHWHGESDYVLDNWIFRGHWDSEGWLLTPKSWRPDGLIARCAYIEFPREIERSPPMASRGKDSTYWKHTETRLLMNFAKAMDAHHLPIRMEHLRESSYPTNRDDPLGAVIEIAGLAQHHRVPTRLLDWTTASVVASFWACDPNARTSTSNQLCVWALNRASFEITPSITNGRIKFHDVPASSGDYLRVQGGLFSETMGADSYFEEHGSWPDILSYLESADTQPEAVPPVMRKVTLPVDQADRLLVMLEREKVTRSHLMPSLDNIATEVLERFEPSKLMGEPRPE